MKLVATRFAALILVLLFAALAAPAQTLERGAVHGIVYDTTHAPIVGAKLTLSNPSTGVRRELTSDADGGYDFESLVPGTYTLVAESSGMAVTTVTNIVVNVGSSLALDVTMPLKSSQQTITVVADEVGAVDTSTSGISQLLDSKDLEHLPLEGRDYRDLAQLSPSAQVVPGLRGGIRLGGQQSDYSGLVIDGADTTNNFFGENFGSLETKNLTVPLEAVQEFQVVTNGFAPEFGRATGGLLNVVTKSGTNDIHGEAHEYYRGGGLTADDALHNPSNISRQNQFGGSVGFPIRKDRQFLFLSTDIQREDGPLQTVFCPPSAANFAACEASLQSAGPVIGPAIAGSGDTLPASCGGASAVGKALLPACYGVPNLAAFEGTHTQFQNFFTILGHYDYQITPANHFSVRAIGTRNHTNGFTGGQGQTETFDDFGNSENFVNQGVSGVFSLTTVLGRKVNEARVSINGETRKRHANFSGAPEIAIQGIGNFGQRFYLPGNNDNGKLQVQDNFSYSFAKHDLKFGGDVNSFVDRKDIFAGWSAGEYVFSTVCDFDPSTCTGGQISQGPNFYFQGLGLNGQDVFKANTLNPAYQTGIGLYWQDKWQLTPRLTLTYGLRWDGTRNPQEQSKIVGQTVWVGQGAGSKQVPVPQSVPNDNEQWGPRVGLAWDLAKGSHPTVVRAAWGLYYAQTPTIFFPTIGGQKSATVFCPGQFLIFCAPESGFPYLFPSTASFGADQLCSQAPGCPSPTYVDPSFRNPRVSNLTVGVEHSFSDWTVSATYAFVHSERLRIGGFSTTNWNRNFTSSGTDQFGRSILTGALDPTIFADTELASFGHGNFHELALAVNKRFAHRYQLFANYTWSRNYSNASSERDTDTFFGPQDPFNLNLDYGRSGLDITHQFKAGAVVDLPWKLNWSTNIIAHSGLAYPAYILTDINGDGVSNQGIGTNDRPVVQLGSGKPFLLPDYPGRQPGFFVWDMRLGKDIHLGERYAVRFMADLFNITNASNLYSSPDNNAFVSVNCVSNAPAFGNTCAPLTALPKPGDANPVGTTYRRLDQLAPGATPFAAQFGVRFQF
ncbi:MAG TPA: TonB-dependent receptor [Candidatus Acidoferrales bacterium]|nr:TonB-dependent receptor [Candidatus Acidoferrales bacterium]